jgi:predicted site-specific integrase-resolvase
MGMSNFYKPVSIIHDLCQQGFVGTKQGSIGKPAEAGLYEHLATLTSLHPHTVYQATIHRFAPVLTPPDIGHDFVTVGDDTLPLLPPGFIRQYIPPETASQFCPTCLQEALYHRLLWMPTPVTACLRHQCLLVSQCPQCGKQTSIRAIVEGCCRQCGTDLATIPAPSLADDTFGLFTQQVIQAWLLDEPLPTQTDYRLPDEPPRTLYRVLDGLYHAVKLAHSDWAYWHPVSQQSDTEDRAARLSPVQRHRMYATAFKGLVKWPEGLHGFLRAYRTRHGAQPSGEKRITADLGALYTTWVQKRWNHPAFQFLQDAVNQYLISDYSTSLSVFQSTRYQHDPELAAQFPSVSAAEAARMLGVSAKTIQLLIDAGHLTQYTTTQSKQRRDIFVRRAEVLALQKRWHAAVTRDEAAHLLGISRSVVVDMVSTGLLTAERTPGVDGAAHWLFHPQAIDECLDAVMSVVHLSNASGNVSLMKATQMLTPMGVNAAALLRYVADGTLQAYRLPTEPIGLSTIQFDPADIRAYLDAVKAERGWLGRDEVTRCLGVKHTTLVKWADTGLLSPIALISNVSYFDRRVVEAFWQTYATSQEAADILGIKKLTVQGWVRQGRLTECCVSGPHLDGHHAYLFHRAKLQAWRHERLTFGETMDMLGISKATLHRWVEQGKLTPLEDMGGKQRWFARGEVELLRNKNM